MAMKIVRELRNYGVFARPMGNVLYMMATPYSDRNEITEVIEKIIHCIRLVYV
jgi:adenosylmethionine-8-amino-7-oxononanoate aminotransferase